MLLLSRHGIVLRTTYVLHSQNIGACDEDQGKKKHKTGLVIFFCYCPNICGVTALETAGRSRSSSPQDHFWLLLFCVSLAQTIFLRWDHPQPMPSRRCKVCSSACLPRIGFPTVWAKATGNKNDGKWPSFFLVIFSFASELRLRVVKFQAQNNEGMARR